MTMKTKKTNYRTLANIEAIKEYLTKGNSEWPAVDQIYVTDAGKTVKIGRILTDIRTSVRRGVIRNVAPYEELGIDLKGKKPKDLTIRTFGRSYKTNKVQASDKGYLLSPSGEVLKPVLPYDFFDILAEAERLLGIKGIYANTEVIWKGAPYKLGAQLKKIKDAYNKSECSDELIELMREKGFEIENILLGSNRGLSSEIKKADASVVKAYAAMNVNVDVYHDYMLQNNQKLDCFYSFSGTQNSINSFGTEIDSLHHYCGVTLAQYAYKSGIRKIEDIADYVRKVRDDDLRKNREMQQEGIMLIRAKSPQEFEAEFTLFQEDPSRYEERHNWTSEDYYVDIDKLIAETAEAFPLVAKLEEMKEASKKANGFYDDVDTMIARGRKALANA